MTWSAVRWISATVGVSLALLGLVDVPEQLAKWAKLYQDAGLDGSSIRLSLILIGLALIGIGVLAQHLPARWRPRYPRTGPELGPVVRSVAGETLSGDVWLDGVEFNECLFRDCTFHYAGRARFLLIGCGFEGRVAFESPDGAVTETVALLKGLGLLGSKEFTTSWKRRTLHGSATSVRDRPPRVAQPELEVLFDADDPSFVSDRAWPRPHTTYFRFGVRNPGGRSVRRVRAVIVGVEPFVSNAWRQVPISGLEARILPVRLARDEPPFERSREGVTLDPSATPTLFLLASREGRSERFDVLHVPANDNLPVNPEMPIRVRVEILGEDVQPQRVAFTFSATSGGELKCELVRGS